MRPAGVPPTPKTPGVPFTPKTPSTATTQAEVARLREQIQRGLDVREAAAARLREMPEGIGMMDDLPTLGGPAGPQAIEGPIGSLRARALSAGVAALPGNAGLLSAGSRSFRFGRPSEAAAAMPEETAADAEAEEAEAANRAQAREEERARLLSGLSDQKGLEAPLTRAERRWRYFVAGAAVVDLFMIIYFVYQGFFLYATGDPQIMDPLAEELAFGGTAVFVIFKDVQIYFRVVDWFPIWLTFVCMLIIGLFYGAVDRWLAIYQGNFPCFIYTGTSYNWAVCQNGLLLIGFVTSVVYLILVAWFMWRWRTFALNDMRRKGVYEEQLNVVELLHTVDNRIDDSLGSHISAETHTVSGGAFGTLEIGLGLARSRAYLAAGESVAASPAETRHRDSAYAPPQFAKPKPLFTVSLKRS